MSKKRVLMLEAAKNKASVDFLDKDTPELLIRSIYTLFFFHSEIYAMYVMRYATFDWFNINGFRMISGDSKSIGLIAFYCQYVNKHK